MKKRILTIFLAVILIAATGAFLIFKNGSSLNIKKTSSNTITVTSKFYSKDTKNTVWAYQYTDKYNEDTKQWDFTNTDLCVLNNGKWQTAKSTELHSNDNVGSIKLEKKATGAYHVIMQGFEKHQASFDKFLVDCATSQVTEEK